MSNLKNVDCNDVNGKVLNVKDVVCVIDIEDLEGDTPYKGEVLVVTECVDPESNYIAFRGNDRKVYIFYGHRVRKVEFVQLSNFEVKFDFGGFKFILTENNRGFYSAGRSVGLYQLDGVKKDFIVSVGWTKSDGTYHTNPEQYGQSDIIKGVTTWDRIKEEAVVYLSKLL